MANLQSIGKVLYKRNDSDLCKMHMFAMSKVTGFYLYEWRKFKGVTQEQLAEALDLQNKGYVSELENGKKRYNQDHLEKAAKFFGCSPGDILNINPLEPQESAEIVEIYKRIPRTSRDEATRMLRSLAKDGTNDD